MASFYSSYVSDLATAGKLIDARTLGAKTKIFPFQYTFLTGGGSAPKVFLTKVPTGYKVYQIFLQSDGVAASGGVNNTCTISDGTVAYITAWDHDVATSSLVIPLAAFGTAYTVDTWVYAQYATGKTPTTGKSIWGYLLAADVS
jgi:hypothetical protein